MEAILHKDNFNRAYKRGKANKGAPGIDGMTVEEALAYLKEHQQELTDRIYSGKYTPSPVRRATIPKQDGGVRKLSSRRQVQTIKPSLEKTKAYARGWLNYYGIASMKKNIDAINGWLYHRIHMCIWKQWKKPKTKVGNLIKMGVPKDLARQAGNSHKGYWFTTHTVAVNMAMTKERLINSGFYDIATAYQSVHVNY